MSGELQQKLIEESSDIATIIEPGGTIRYVSPASFHVLGYEPEELVGGSGYEYQHPDDGDAVAEAIETVIANPEATQTVEARFQRVDGSWCWIEATLQNRLADRDIGGILVNCRDITARKKREQQYRNLAEEYETLLETVDDGIFFLSVESTDADDEFRFWRLNQAYEETTGITTDDVRGKIPTAVFGDELGAQLEANYRRCVAARRSIQYEEEVPIEPGARFWQTRLTPVIIDGSITEIIGITRNITERVKHERQLRSQKEQLDDFAGVISHDIRNPLNVAQGWIEILKQDCDSAHIPPIVRSLARIDELVTDTLTLARQGQVVDDPEPVQLINTVEVCWETVSTEDATIEIEDDVTINGDRSRLQHVFENLFRNAVEHGGTAVTVRVGQIDEYGIYVEDTGPGIPEADRDDVCQPGHSSASGGTGFGLTIIKRIAEAHGWKMQIVDGSDGGARFEFTDVDIIS